MTSLIYILSNKTNLAPVVIQLILLFLMWLIISIMLDDFKFITTIYLMLTPIIILLSGIFVGKSWFIRPQNNYNKKL